MTARTGAASRLRSEIYSIKQSGNDIESILASTSDMDPLASKLKLLELLCSKMVSIELKLLTLSEKFVTKPSTVLYGFPSDSRFVFLFFSKKRRLPSFLALSERVIELCSLLDATPNNNHSENLSTLGDLCTEIEGHAIKLATGLSISNTGLIVQLFFIH